MMEIGKLSVSGNFLNGSKVDAAQHYMRLAARTHISLQRRLAVKLDGKVDNAAALHKAIRRRVGPSSGNVYTHRTASPNYLIAINRHTRTLLLGKHLLSKSVTQKSKGFIFIVLILVATNTRKF